MIILHAIHCYNFIYDYIMYICLFRCHVHDLCIKVASRSCSAQGPEIWLQYCLQGCGYCQYVKISLPLHYDMRIYLCNYFLLVSSNSTACEAVGLGPEDPLSGNYVAPYYFLLVSLLYTYHSAEVCSVLLIGSCKTILAESMKNADPRNICQKIKSGCW